MKKILVPVDGSAESKKAASQAVLLAEKFGSEVTLITVVEIENDMVITEFGIAVSSEYAGVRDALIKIKVDSSNKMLDALIESLETDIPVHRIVKVGSAHPDISGEAAKGEYDLIVMGHRGLNPVKRFFMGSVAKRVIEDAPCSVLIVKE
ncbi:MAG: universal stress protein [Clostridiales bacterium]|nr:universal stress protein [Clostridiales bacterium]